jgi:hypothetical protein
MPAPQAHPAPHIQERKPERRRPQAAASFVATAKAERSDYLDGVATYPSLSVPRKAITSSISASLSAGWSPWWRL